jgi:hypothetical protein
MSGATAVQVVYVSRRGSRSAVASSRTTCSGVCFLAAMSMPGPLVRNAGRKTLKRSGSRNAATKGGAAVTPGWIYINPPDPEGRIRISAAVAGELPGEALPAIPGRQDARPGAPHRRVTAIRPTPPTRGGRTSPTLAALAPGGLRAEPAARQRDRRTARPPHPATPGPAGSRTPSGRTRRRRAARAPHAPLVRPHQPIRRWGRTRRSEYPTGSS